MEKVNLSSSSSDKLKTNTWEYATFSFEKDGAYGFSWPQRHYTCSFCKKDFKSAQALGGHMNVHRRERAKMRLQLPMGDYLNPNAKPNSCSSSPSSSAAKFLPYKNSQTGFLPPSLPSTPDEEKVPALVFRTRFDPVTPGHNMGKSLNKRAFAEVRDLQFLTTGNDSVLWKKKDQILRVGLNMSFLHDAKDHDLDLELRLGHTK